VDEVNYVSKVELFLKGYSIYNEMYLIKKGRVFGK